MMSKRKRTKSLNNKSENIKNKYEEQQQAASIALQTASYGALDAFSAIQIIPDENKKGLTLSSTDTLGLANLRIAKILNHPLICLKPIDLTPAAEPCSQVRVELSKITRNCVQCAKTLRPYPTSSILFWQTMEFCNQYCLINFQMNRIGSKCHYCKMNIILKNYGTYGLRFGTDFLFFCSKFCFTAHKNYAILCNYCETIITKIPKPQIISKEKHVFCSTVCCDKYFFDANQSPVTINKDVCCKCKGRKKAKLSFKKKKKIHKFCSQSCFAAFKLQYEDAVTKITDCVVCCRIFDNQENFKKYSIFVNSTLINICSLQCQKFYIITFRKLISCQSCLIQKFNTDMIRRTFPGGVELTTCSIHCLMVTIIKEELPCEAKMICRNCNEMFKSLYWYLNIDQTDVFCSKSCIENTLKLINGLSFPIPDSETVINANETSN